MVVAAFMQLWHPISSLLTGNGIINQIMIDDGSFLFFTAKFLAIYVIILMGLLMVIDIRYALKWYEYWIFGGRMGFIKFYET